jgi:hypothetical protein
MQMTLWIVIAEIKRKGEISELRKREIEEELLREKSFKLSPHFLIFINNVKTSPWCEYILIPCSNNALIS